MKTVSIDKFAQDGARDFSYDQWSQQVLDGSTKKRNEYCKDNDGVICYSGAVQGHSGGIAVGPKIMGYFLISQHWKKYLYHRGRSWDSICVRIWIDSGRKGDRQSSSGCFLTPTNRFGNVPEEERAYDDLTVPQKGPSLTSWKPTQNAVFWVRLSEVEDLGLEFWQTKSFAIMTYAKTPGDCIDRVTSDGGDRVLLRTTWNSKATAQGNIEQELAMPAATFHFWHRLTELVGTRAEKRGLTWSSRRFETRPWRPGNWEQSVSTKDEIHSDDVDVTTSTLPSGDANNQIIERIKVGSKEICIREDPVKESMEFSQKSTQADQERQANVELIESRTSKIHQCPSCGHAVFKRDNSLHMWQAYATKPGDDTMY